MTSHTFSVWDPVHLHLDPGGSAVYPAAWPGEGSKDDWRGLDQRGMAGLISLPKGTGELK